MYSKYLILKFSFFLLLSNQLFSQSKKNEYVNSGAISNNINCGIGEVFIIPKLSLQNKEENKKNFFLSVYPNPVEDILYFDKNINIEMVNLYDINGKFLSFFVVNNNFQIDLSHLSSGVYILKSNNSLYNPIKIIKK